MGKKNHQNRKSNWVPPVGSGGIQKKHHDNRPPLLVTPSFPHPHHQPNRFHIPGYPILPFSVRLVPGGPPPPNCGPPFALPPPIVPPSSLPFIFPPLVVPPPRPSPPSVPSSVSFIPPSAPVNAPLKSPRGRTPKRVNTGNAAAAQRNPKGPGENAAKKTQIKYARMMSSRAKRTSIAVVPEVKSDPDAPSFNLFMNIAQRYHGVQKEPDAIDIQSEEEDDDVEEIEREEYEGNEIDDEEIEEGEENDAANCITIGEDMSICTVDEVGDETITPHREARGEEREYRDEAEIEISEDEDEEGEGEDIVCLGEHKSNHVMSETETVVLGDDDSECEIEEVDVANETTMMNKAFSEKSESLRPMEQSIVDLSLDDDVNLPEKVASTQELPDFIPLIDGQKKKNKGGKGKQSSSPFVQRGGTTAATAAGVQQVNGGQQQNVPSTSFPLNASVVMISRPKSNREKKREMYRKRAEVRALDIGASPCSIGRALAASTCTFPPTVTPSKIPMPNGAAPPTPLAHLWRFPPGSSSILPSSIPSSAMGLIQSRGISTSSTHSQPLGMGGIGMPHPPHSSLISGVGGVSASSPPTLAAVLQDEAAGVVRDALTVSGMYRRQWEEKWMANGGDSLSRPDTKVDPSAAPFRICSYNVLCQKTISATGYLYRHTKFQPHVLEWSHRWPLIQRELSELSADVFGLQEIQDVHFEEFYEPFMKSLGYICLFQRKSESFHSDGLGVFVRANRFKIASKQTVDFLVPGDNLMNRGNVAQLLRLECLQTGAPLIVTNTHILFNEKRGDVKLAQIALLMANIHAIRQDDEPVICLGDWNLEPTSDLYNYITNGSLDASQFVPRYGSGQLREGRNFNFAPMRELPMDTHLKTRMSRDGVLYQNEGALLQSLRASPPSKFSHQIPLCSTYAPYMERQVSTFHKDIANPDFIFYTTEGRGECESRRLRLIRRLAVPPESNIRQNLEPWPNHHIPSDHIPLMAEFYLAK